MTTMIITLIGLLILIAGMVLLLIEAFATSIFWGLACLFINPMCLLFLARYWKQAKLSFYIQVVGLSVLLIGYHLHQQFNF
ncbi:hypothetical protein [uncultured Paraglaciecola sp.]|jgi:hypothetical protein|uniref:hypothetical protein n=1 Tax=uncultured Paraglaciecola sp. TaxID=1765024 RepID=UPI0030DC377D|tara:strand:- start:868 stop:1110 length:243 start_codon:yes stop_codon:yes gene_type:complete